jgi:hypothetical protein
MESGDTDTGLELPIGVGSLSNKGPQYAAPSHTVFICSPK